MLIQDRVKNFIEKYNLSEPFIVAFSGGYDSMCLANILNNLRYKIILVHLNHSWRGAESDNEEANCNLFAQSHNIEFYSERLSEKVPKTETAARDARYDFFKRCAEKFNSKVVFTAHNFEDNAETVLYRIIKGTGTVGLSGIAEKRDIFYRPLLKVKRAEIEKYCLDNNLNPNKDSSNENVKYKRNLIRKVIIPLMKTINPNVTDAINSLSDIAKEDINGNNRDKYFIRKLLIDNNIDYDREKIEYIQNFIDENQNSKSGKKMSLSDDLWLYVNDRNIEVVKKAERCQSIIQINSEGEFEFGDYIFSLKPFKDTNFNYPKDIEQKAIIEIDNINFTLRYRHDGDIINPLGMKGFQKLKKYLNEKKIAQHKKDKLLLLCQGKEVLWVAGVGLSEKLKVKNKPTHIIELRGKYE